MSPLHTPLPESAKALFHAACDHLSAGRPEQAESGFREACERFPDFAEAHANLGFLLDARGETAAAEAEFREALALGARNPELFLNLGALLAGARRFEEAQACYEQGLSHSPESASLWTNLGAQWALRKREAEAQACYERALEIAPEHEPARFNLAYLQLRQGRLTEGFENLEARDWYAAFSHELGEKHGIARWQGEALSGKTFLIVCEAGQGDMIQFCRYASDLKRLGAARVDVLCHPSLVRLFERLDGADRIFPLGTPFPFEAWDFWSPPLSLPHFCGTQLTTIPACTPYLHAAPEDRERWRPRLPARRPRIGLVWKGSRAFENDAERSLPHFDLLAPLLENRQASFVSLQKGQGEDEISSRPRPFEILEAGPELRDFADTAGLIAELDLVIGVDTAVAHLAGALAKPCWLLLPDFLTDWRWLADRKDSPWYPGMRLFRQAAQGGWPALMPTLDEALTRFIESEG